VGDTHTADTVLQGGRIFLGLAEGFAESIALAEGRVIAAGRCADLETLIGPSTRRIDLRGRAVLPGFNDGHQHMLLYGLEQMEVNLHPAHVRSLAELQDRLRERATAAHPDEWILGRRYDHFHLDIARHPTRDELDAVTVEQPIFITRTCGHVGVVNSRALALAGIDETTPDPPGGRIAREDGRPTGVLFETAMGLVKKIMPALSEERMVAALELAGRDFLSQGITSITDAGLGLRQGVSDLVAYRAAHDAGRLPVRAYVALTGGPGGIERELRGSTILGDAGGERFKLGPIKLFADGSAGGKTAAMTLPYICACENFGLFVYQDAEITELVRAYHDLGYQVAIHAIGDAAIDQALNAVEAAMEANPGGERRHRVEHCSFTRPDQIERMVRLGMVAAPQPIFLYEFGELYLDVLGDDRPAAAYPMRRWIDAGLRPIASSDTPVSDVSPMKNLYSMVTRKTDRGSVLGAGERIGLPEAVSALTANGAYGSFSESQKGTLAPGMLADLVVLDRDIFDFGDDELLATRADLTLLEGEIVFDRRREI
jgi:predicted amidohydrolase YtcJ